MGQWAKKSDEEEEDELPLGMEEAFEKLNSLESLDDVPSSKKPAAASSKESPSSSLPLEQEIEVYKKMVTESESSDDVYGDVMSDMSGSKQNPATAMDPEAAMQQALAEAMQEVSEQNPKAADGALDDKEIMKEIEAIMERGNAELLASLEEIRQEQVGRPRV